MWFICVLNWLNTGRCLVIHVSARFQGPTRSIQNYPKANHSRLGLTKKRIASRVQSLCGLAIQCKHVPHTSAVISLPFLSGAFFTSSAFSTTESHDPRHDPDVLMKRADLTQDSVPGNRDTCR